MPRCQSCGAWTDDDEGFCDQCGVRVPDTPDGARWEKATIEGDSGGQEPGRTETRQERGRSTRGDLPLPKREQILEFVLGHPLRRGRRPVLVSAVLLLGSVLVIPALVLAGYSYRLGRSVVFEEEQPPEYNDIGHLVMDGVRLVIVVSLPTLLWLLGTLMLTGILLLVLPVAGGLVPLIVVLSGAMLLWFAGAFVAAFIGSDSVIGAFTNGHARTLRSNPGYLRSWLLVVLLSVVLTVALALTVGPFFVLLAAGVPSLLVLLLSPLFLAATGLVLAYALLVGTTLAGYVYYVAADRDVVPAPEESAGMGPGDVKLGETTE